MPFTEITAADVARVLDRLPDVKRRGVRESNGPHSYARCVECGKAEHMTVNEETGMWDCKVCRAQGNLWQLADKIGVRVRSSSAPKKRKPAHVSVKTGDQGVYRNVVLGPAPKKPVPNGDGLNIDTVRAQHARLWDPSDKEAMAVADYARSRGLSDETIKKFLLVPAGFKYKDKATDEWLRVPALGIPFFDGAAVPMLKKRNITAVGDRFARTKGGKSRLFNVDDVRGKQSVVLVGAEIDCMSLKQMGVQNVAAMPIGEKGHIPDEWLEDMEDAEDVVLWFDPDPAGNYNVFGLAEQLGTVRCRLVVTPDYESNGKKAKDANDLLRMGAPVELVHQAIAKASGFERADVVRAGAFVDAIIEVVSRGDAARGIPTPYHGLNRLIGGCRPGELIAVIGHPAHGKSTFVDMTLMEMADAGTRCLVSSLENGPKTIDYKRFQRSFGRSVFHVGKQGAEAAGFAEAIAALDSDNLLILDNDGKRVSLQYWADVVRFVAEREGVSVWALDHADWLDDSAMSGRRFDNVGERNEEKMRFLKELCEETKTTGIVIKHVMCDENKVPGPRDIKGGLGTVQSVDVGLSVFRLKEHAGEAAKSKPKIKNFDGRKLEIDLAPNQVLVPVWKVRADGFGTGTVVMDFDKAHLAYKDLSAVDAPGVQEALWGDNGLEPGNDDDPFA